MGGLKGALRGSLGGRAELQDVGQLTGLFPGCPRGILGDSGNCGPCPGNCYHGNI
jgi:hypothetical protein